MDSEKHYKELEERYKSRRFDMHSLLEELEEEDDSLLYPALDSVRNNTARYSKHKFIAEGGEKRIESAFDELTQRTVALARPKLDSPTAQERFLKEARLMAYLEHPNIMPVYDIGFEKDLPYFTMELFEGDNLTQKRGQGKISGEKLDELLVVLLRVCDAVSFAHSKGIVHLDIKPHNIQTGPFGEVLLCDWGLSKTIDSVNIPELPDSLDQDMTADLTINGVLRGTPGYMSPNLCQGNPGKKEDDIYALGATLYFILCGECPHQSEDVKEIIAQTVLHEPQPIRARFPNFEIPQALEAVALKALSREGYSSVAELKQDINKFLRGYATAAEDAGFITQIKLLYRRQKVLCNTILAALLTVAVLTLFFINSLHQEKEKELAARLIAEKAQSDAEESMEKYKSELRFNRYLMDGIDQSLQKIIREVQKKNLPVDIQKILVKVGRGNINADAYEAAAQMLETLAVNSTGTVKDDAVHDLIFLRIFMHDFTGALEWLKTLRHEELERADIFQFIPICEKYKDRTKNRGVLGIEDFRELVMEVKNHERPREWYYKHAFGYYLRKCLTDKEVMDLYEVALDLNFPNRKYKMHLTVNYGKKTLFFSEAEQLTNIYMPQILDALELHSVDLRGTSVNSLIFARQLSIKEINASGTPIVDLRPLSFIEGFEKVIVSDLEKVKWWKQLRKLGVVVEEIK